MDTATKTVKTVTLWCEAGKHNWERPSQRGRRPFNCPEHQPQDEPVALPAVVLESVEGDTMAIARAAKAIKAERRAVVQAQRSTEDAERELTTLAGTIPTLEAEYAAALKRACRVNGGTEEIDKAFHTADVLQDRLMHCIQRARVLRAQTA